MNVKINVFKNLIEFVNNFNKNFKVYCINNFNIFKIYTNVNNNKIYNKNYNKNKLVIIINLKKKNSNIVLIKKNKCCLTINNGYIFKKLKLNNKKNIKSNKLIFIAIKTLFLKLNLNKKFEVMVNIKGLVVNDIYKKIMNQINKSFSKKGIKMIYINSLKKSSSNAFGFKKIKSIKRRLKKKNLKL